MDGILDSSSLAVPILPPRSQRPSLTAAFCVLDRQAEFRKARSLLREKQSFLDVADQAMEELQQAKAKVVRPRLLSRCFHCDKDSGDLKVNNLATAFPD